MAVLIRLVGAAEREMVVVVDDVGNAVGVVGDDAGVDGDAAGTVGDAAGEVGEDDMADGTYVVGGADEVGGAVVVGGAGIFAKAANCSSRYSRSSWQNRASLGDRPDTSTHSRSPPAMKALSTGLRSAADVIAWKNIKCINF